MKLILSILSILILSTAFSQLNIQSTNLTAENILKGDYDPVDYEAVVVVNDPDLIVQGINSTISADSLKSYLEVMSAFLNRNTGSDTVSATEGIGAARRWAYTKFEQFSATHDSRLVTSYLQFDQLICGMGQHRNVFAVLPGTDVENHQVIVIEAHLDSRCEGSCDTDCEAHGMEDNGSGSALVLELARVMSHFTYKNTFVFMLTTGEEQGLYGANAFSQYAKDENIPIKAVLNNDVIGGVICGETSSAPSCPGLNDVDSTQVRFFTAGGFNSPHKQLARYIKLQYHEELLTHVTVPMQLTVMSAEDRTGRGGDHIPFRQDGFTAMRFTSANEHGDAGIDLDYHDRQHTSDDILGLDTDGDELLDSFFVDFNYLARNAAINGIGGAMIAIGPKSCDFLIETFAGPGMIIRITEEIGYPSYRVGLRTVTNDWDSVYVMVGNLDTIYPPTSDNYIISVASVDNNGIESLFSREITFSNGELSLDGVKSPVLPFELMQNRPNPFDEATIIGVRIHKSIQYTSAYISIRDIQGREVERIPIQLNGEMNEVLYTHGYGKIGTFAYTLVIDGVDQVTKMMVFAN